MSLREKLLVERRITAAQEPEVWALRDLLKRRRKGSRLRLAARPDRPVLVACGRGKPGGHAEGLTTLSVGRTARHPISSSPREG